MLTLMLEFYEHFDRNLILNDDTYSTRTVSKAKTSSHLRSVDEGAANRQYLCRVSELIYGLRSVGRYGPPNLLRLRSCDNVN